MKTNSLVKRTTTKTIVLLGLILLGFNAMAQKEKLQTAFVYQLTRLIEWCPDGKAGSFVIGVVGDNSTLVAELTALQVRKVADQSIEVKGFASIDQVTRCNILFIPDAKASDFKNAAAKIGTHCTLIIGDQLGDADMGAGVSIVYLPESSKIQYEISKKYMTKYSLNVNDQLYKLASRVY